MFRIFLTKFSSQPAAQLATVIASIFAMFAIGLGYLQFRETQVATRQALRLQADTLQHERDSKAIEFFIKFNELQRDLSEKALSQKSETTFWQYNMLLALTESVYRLTEGDPGWYETVRWMVKSQRSFLEGTPQGCVTMTPAFVRLMKDEVPRTVCE